jgi:outer membrane receptor for ferrienterochelin and colicins
VINIITRRIGDEWNGSATHSYTRPGDGKRGDTQQIGATFSGPLGERFGLRIGANSMRRDSDQSNHGVYGNAYAGEKDRTVDALLQWKLSDAQELSLEAGHGVQQAFIDASLESRTKAPGEPVSSSAARWRSTDGTWSFGTSRLSAYWTEYKNDIGATGRSEATDTIIEGSLTTPFTLGVEHQFAVGGQWKRQELTNTDTIGRAPIDYAGNAVSGSSWKWIPGRLCRRRTEAAPHLALTVGAPGPP